MRYRVVLAIPATMSVIASFAAARDFSLNARKVPFISATKLLTRDANLTVVDSGNINVHATNRVAVKIVGNGTIGYAGKPSDVSQTIQGMRVRQAALKHRKIPWRIFRPILSSASRTIRRL